jgi:hypothetical protein
MADIIHPELFDFRMEELADEFLREVSRRYTSVGPAEPVNRASGGRGAGNGGSIMKALVFVALVFAVLFPAAGSWCAEPIAAREQVKAEARRGFEEILDLWRDWNYDALYKRILPAAGSDKWHFVDQLNHSARRPACCWEKIQDVSVVYVDGDTVILAARLGIEVEGFGTRFVTRSIRLVREQGVWKIAEAEIIDLAEPNMQRIPREILERPL